MDDVARAASMSRQGLYLHFATKEDLFRAAVHHLLEGSLSAASDALHDKEKPFGDRVVRAIDEWIGRFVGVVTAADLIEASAAIVGPAYLEYERRFLELLIKSVRASGLVAAYKSANINAQQLAETLYATARGFKHTSKSREAFVASVEVAVRAMCMPLDERPRER